MTMRSRASASLAAVAGVILVLAAGWLVPAHPEVVAVVALGVLALGLSAWDAALVPLLLLPLLYISQRVSVGGVDLSVSDAALAVALVPAAVLGSHRYTQPVRRILWLTAIYQVATLFTVVATPYVANVVEWAHAGLLVGGAFLVGWAVGREGRGPLGLRLMLVAACILAGWVLLTAARHLLVGSFEPVYLPFGMHKNFLGTVLGTTALVAYVRPSWLGMSRWAGATAFVWLAAAVTATQSRQAIVALGVALTVLVLRSRTDRRRSKAVLLLVAPALLVVLTLVRDQVASGDEFNSFYARLTWFADSLDLWETSPVLGVGLRWWYTDRFAVGFQPPNAEMEVLTSAGVVGLAAFLTLMVGTVVVLGGMDPAYGTLAMLVVLSRFIQGQLDAFWLAAQTSIPCVIAGICLGVQARHLDEGEAPGARQLQEEAQSTVELAP